MNDRFILTGSQRNEVIPAEGLAMARILGLEIVPRERKSIASLQESYQANGVMVWQEDGPVLNMGGQKIFFHPSMAKARISMLRKGLLNDPMLAAMKLTAGASVLDCTLGLGADAIVTAFATGSAGQVVGLEKSPVLAALVAHGLSNYATDIKSLEAAMRLIKVINADHFEYLQAQPSAAFDVVYFDPMFRQPVNASTGIKPLRLLAEGASLEKKAIEVALRVASKRVVIKERRGSTEFERLGCQWVEGSASSPVAYGIIEVGGNHHE